MTISSGLTSGFLFLCVYLILHETSGWYLAMKFPRGNVGTEPPGVMDLWQSTEGLDDPQREYPIESMAYFHTMAPYKAPLDDWFGRNVQQVKLSFFLDEVEKAFVVFNASHSTRTSWFACDKIIDSSYGDLLASDYRVCELNGQENLTSSFVVMMNDSMTSTDATLCDTIKAWIMVLDLDEGESCHWGYGYYHPMFLFANASQIMNPSGFLRAQIFAVFIDDCAGRPCQNGGTCTNIAQHGHTCDCRNDHFGTECETRCPCQNSGDCIRLTQSQMDSRAVYVGNGNIYNQSIEVVPGTRVYCGCRPGFTGYLCEKDIDNCEHNPCKHGGVCQDEINGFKCICEIGYTGDNCTVKAGKEMNEESQFQGGITAAIVVPIIVLLIIAATVYCVYVYRNPHGYGRKQTFKTVVLVRDTIRRSFRRLSGRGRRPRQQLESISDGHIETATHPSRVTEQKSPHELPKQPYVYEQDVFDDDDDEGGFASKSPAFNNIPLEDTKFDIPTEKPSQTPTKPVAAPRRQTGRRQTRNEQNRSMEDPPPPYFELNIKGDSTSIPSTTI